MDWKKTSIVVTLNNSKYPKGHKGKSFNNIVPEPTKEQIDLFVEALLMLSDGSTVTGTEIIRHNTLIAE